jgi:iron complex outermembrane receptor protein
MTMGISKSCLAWAGVVALIGPLQALADAPAATSELEEITVTAQKRSESQQTVPLSITTFGAVALQEKAVVDFFDYGTKVPNLGFAYTGDGMSTARTISIRGVSGDNVTGFYVDETPLPDSLDPRILDIDHIEVLRGPQGTLYGARSMGGTVRVITKTPDFTDSEVTVHAGMSDTARTDQPNYTGDIVANFPIVADRAALRLSAFMDDNAGYFKRRYCTDPATAGVTCFPQTTGPLMTTVDNVGEVKTYGAAIGLSIKLTDDMMLTPKLLQQKSTYNGFLMSDVLTASGSIGYPYPSYSAPPIVLPSLVPNNFTQGRFFNIPEGGFDNWQLNSIDFKWNTGVGEFVSSSSYFTRKVVETEDETDFIWADLLPLGQILNPAYPLPRPIPSAISEEKDYQRFVEEVRFASQLSGPVQFVAGAFYSDLHGAIPFAANYARHHLSEPRHSRRDLRLALQNRHRGAGGIRSGLVRVLGGMEGHRRPALEPGEDHRRRLPGRYGDSGAGGAGASGRRRHYDQGKQHDAEARARLSNHAGRYGLYLRRQGIQARRSGAFGARRHLCQPVAGRHHRRRDSRL